MDRLASDMMRTPKILFVINSLAGGGAERVLLALLEASRDRLGHDVDFSVALLDDEARDYPPPDWLPLHQLDCRFSLARSIRQLAGLCRTVRPDVTVSFLTRANVASVIVARLLGHRAIISERANTSAHFKPGLSGRLAKASVRLTYPRADRIIAVSQGIATDLADNFGVAAARIDTIANPVPYERIVEQGREDPALAIDGPYAAVVSRLTPSKNIPLVLQALARLPGGLKLVVMGQGAERPKLEALAAELGIADRVTFAGFLPNPHAVVARAAFYVSGSNGEGFPNGQVEALSLGVPVLATNCASGPSEILADRRREDVQGLTFGAYGVLVPPNDVEAMAHGMAAILEPDNQARYRAAGPRRVRDYSLDRAKTRYWASIESVIGRA